MAEYLTPYNRGLTRDEMEINARYFAAYLLGKGWTLQAICGALGNWESECKLNPNDPQNDANGFPTSSSSRSGGYGLAQWTPCSNKILWWCEQKGITPTRSDDSPAGSFEMQIEYHEYECKYGLKGSGDKTWYSNHGYSYSWEEYKTSTDDPAVLANAYYWQYERSAALDPATRPNQAIAWYNFLSGSDLPDVPGGGGSVTLPGKMSLNQLLLYTKRRPRRCVVR